VDVSQDVIITSYDCGTEQGIMLRESDAMESGRLTEKFERRILGRIAASPIADPNSGEILVSRNEEIDEVRSRKLAAANVKEVYVRSALACILQFGVCQLCYGRSLANGKLVEIGEAVGIIAAQSIGEPGTQLTMRTFHTGGVAGSDITSGLPRVEELFEARVPKAQAILSEIDGVVEIVQEGDIRKMKVISTEIYTDSYDLPANFELTVREGDEVREGDVLGKSNLVDDTSTVNARLSGRISQPNPTQLVIRHEEREERDYDVPHAAELRVSSGDKVKAGDPLTSGSSNPQEILHILGTEAVQRYLIDEVQRVYRSQGVNTNEKHMEVIIRQMLRKVQIESSGDTDLLGGELVDRFQYEEINSRVLAEGGEPATAQTVLLGVTKAALKTDSFLSAASFQETTRVLTEAAIQGSVDRLRGLKENVIIGKLIPAGSGVRHRPKKKTKVSLTELLDIDPDNEEQMRYMAEMEEEIEDVPGPEHLPAEILMQLPPLVVNVHRAELEAEQEIELEALMSRVAEIATVAGDDDSDEDDTEDGDED
jgi:DNA-directed RNA polymerase subunit beta'